MNQNTMNQAEWENRDNWTGPKWAAAITGHRCLPGAEFVATDEEVDVRKAATAARLLTSAATDTANNFLTIFSLFRDNDRDFFA